MENLNRKETVSLKDYMDTKFDSIEKATDLAGENLKTRLDSLNEWRLQNKDERNLYVTKESRKDNLALWIALGSILVSVVLHFL